MSSNATNTIEKPKRLRLSDLAWVAFGIFCLFFVGIGIWASFFHSRGENVSPFGPDPTVTAREERIQRELATLGDHEWAGHYYEGDGLGKNVSFMIAPGSGFAYEWSGCLGTYDQNYGDVTDQDGVIRLHPQRPNGEIIPEGIGPDLVPVRWGERHYLLEANELLEFCNQVNEGSEPRIGSPYGDGLLRQDEWKKPVDGRPDLPAEFRKYLLDKPIVAGITAVGESKVEHVANRSFERRTTKVTLNAGSNQGTFVGMRLSYNEPPAYRTAVVTVVHEQTSEAEISESVDKTNPPAKGWKLSTRR